MKDPRDILCQIEDAKLPEDALELATPSGIVCLDDFLAAHTPEPQQIILGVLRKGQVGLLASNSKAGKTWLMQSLAVAVATGKMWLAWKTCPGRVLLIDPELPRYDAETRMKKVKEALGVAGPTPDIDYFRTKGRTLNLAQLRQVVRKRMQETGLGYALIIVDSIYCFQQGRDENDNTAQAQTMQELYELSEETAAAVMTAHHFSKGFQSGKNHMDRASGAGVFARAPDAIITLTELEEDGCYGVEATCRSFAKPAGFAVRWDYPLWKIDENIDHTALKTPQSAMKEKKKKRVQETLNLLDASGMTRAAWKQKCLNAGMSDGAFNNYFRDLALSDNPQVIEIGGRYVKSSR